MQAQGNTKMKPPKKRKPKARKEIQAAQTADAIREPLQPMLAHGRSLSDFEPLLVAERMLLQACRMGEIAEISKQRPKQATEQNTVRAGFLRFLLLGGDEQAPVHERGVHLWGMWITGRLDLSHTSTVSAITCIHCTFDETLILRHSQVHGGVFLNDSAVPGLQGDGMEIKGAALLRGTFQAYGPIRLLGAKINGNLECDSSKFDGQGKTAFNLDGAVIRGSIFMRAGCSAIGTVRLGGAQISGALDCTDAQFNGHSEAAIFADGATIQGGVFLRGGFKATGSTRFSNTYIRGNFECTGSDLDGHGEAALILDSATIQGSVFLRDGLRARGPIRLLGTQISGDLDCTNAQFDCNAEASIFASNLRVAGRFFFDKLKYPARRVWLTAASVGVLIDNADAWGEGLMLDGFTYGNLGSGAQISAYARLAWLDKQQPGQCGFESDGTDFRPQPWRQLQKVLREMGHVEDARQVAIAFEDRLRRADLIGLSPANWRVWQKRTYRLIGRGFHYGFGILTGYGYRPMRLLGWFFGVWLGCAIFYWCAALPPNNVFAPSNPLVFQEAAYAACVPGSDAAKLEQAKPVDAMPAPVKGAGNWYLCEKLRAEYTGFSPLAYSLDVILPLVDLQQQKDWSPMIPTPKAVWWQELRGSGWKHITRMVVWAETLFGWLASLLLVAIVSGLTKRRED